nr:3-hexulose-6-phosphate synthase [Neobacillus sp. Marseille-Q6967]
MNLQLALDRLTRDECFQLLQQTKDSIDWIEVGTGVIKEYGMSIVREIKQAYPDKVIVADMKTCDAGKHEAIQAFKAGADITTVMAFSADKTILDTLEAAQAYKKRIMIDLLGVTDRNRIHELLQLGVELVSLHFGKDMQTEGEMGAELYALTSGFEILEVAVAGGINLESLPRVMEVNPDTIIVGSAITKAENPAKTAAVMKGLLNR